MKFEELQIVKLTGTIVHICEKHEAYEIEMIGQDGRTIVLFTIKHEDLEQMQSE